MSALNIPLFSKPLTLVVRITVYVVTKTAKEHVFIFKRSRAISWWISNPMTNTAPITHPVMQSHIVEHQKHWLHLCENL